MHQIYNECRFRHTQDIPCNSITTQKNRPKNQQYIFNNRTVRILYYVSIYRHRQINQLPKKVQKQ